MFTTNTMSSNTQSINVAMMKNMVMMGLAAVTVAASMSGVDAAADYTISMPSPGNQAHCTEITFQGGKDNAYWLEHGYQYTTPPWSVGPCDRVKYNWFNNKKPIASGVVETLLGSHTKEEQSLSQAQDAYCLHQEDTEDHKCFEACNAEGTPFKSKGIAASGKCPSKYSTVDKVTKVQQCPDGVTSIRYCTPINVTIDTMGEAGQAMAAATEPSFMQSAPSGVVDCTHGERKSCSSNNDCVSSHCECPTPSGYGGKCISGGVCQAPTIRVTNDYTATAKIRACTDKQGYKCKTYRDCAIELGGSTLDVLVGDDVQYFVFAVTGSSDDHELYPDADYRWATKYDIKPPSEVQALEDAWVQPSAEVHGAELNVSCRNPSTCLQLNIPGGADNEFWKANRYKYDSKLHPECSQTTCGAAYPQYESVVHNVQGYAGVDLVKYGKP